MASVTMKAMTTYRACVARCGGSNGSSPRELPISRFPLPIRDARDELHFDDAAVLQQAGRSDGRPRRVGWLHELADHRFESSELFVARTSEVRPLPDVEAVDHGHVLEVRAGGFEDGAQARKRATCLHLERGDVVALTGTRYTMTPDT